MTSNRLTTQDLRDALEAAGLRPTPQRLAVYDQLAAMPSHPTAEQVFQAVRPRLPRISLATVYKALEALVAVGVVDRLGAESAAGSARYDARGDRHYHFRCIRTGAIHDLPTEYDPRLIDRLDPALADDLRSRGFQVTGYRLELLGYRLPGRDAEPRGGPDE
ncbi:Fur family transcriptional regulator [Paludisphaera rhizosphaerae]|uniref:Fur family transcriptional regulator n=1 Tax=Paludisphaera rhizosphaerae TaxID=2711216 RepID=UPI0013EC870F|nr:transcriptional repressor [Paludisphaera rhizosphaerae]